MNKLQIFESTDFGTVRTVLIDKEPYFVGKDVCEAFDDKNHNRSLGRIDEEDKRREQITDVLGRKQEAVLINESGLYALLFAMQPQKANHDGVSDAYPIEVRERIEKLRRFKRWALRADCRLKAPCCEEIQTLGDKRSPPRNPQDRQLYRTEA